MWKICIFDFGRVLVQFEPEQIVAGYVADRRDREKLCEVVFDRRYWDALDRGEITDDEAKRDFCTRLPERLHRAACDCFDHWIEHLPPVAGMEALLDELRARGVKLYLLSNISRRFAETYPAFPELASLFARFDGLVFSGPLGIAKPSPAIFTHLLDTFGLKAEDCLFIDDNADNLAGAKAVGIAGYLFDGDAERLRAALL